MKRPAWFERRRQTWLTRRHPTSTDTTRLKHNQIYVLPTGFGFAFAVTALLVLIGAINYQLSLAYAFAFLMFGIGHAGLLQGFRNLLGLHVTVGQAEPVFTGENAHFPIRLISDKARISIYLSAGRDSVVAANIQPRSSNETWLPVPAIQRGWLVLPTVQLESRYPTQLCRAWSYARLAARVLVYPQPESNAPPYQLASNSDEGGSVWRRGEDDFAGLRRYQPGDPIRRIAWKQAARDEHLSIKQFDSPQSAAYRFDWHDLALQSAESRLSRLTAWVLAADLAGDRYGLTLPGTTLPLDHGPAHRTACLTALALFEAQA
ncbi:DUF58 domain-containing protein [Andreprevotia chitinilytica]|uniref:DUF58 domain-containing protein n=1 Tax=Andreprevotia chitinilytica TaxID=396808 RepID=UPI0006906FE8|nr:DUF58 domain-containing protein [Andreprevotia chitinilytica]